MRSSTTASTVGARNGLGASLAGLQLAEVGMLCVDVGVV